MATRARPAGVAMVPSRPLVIRWMIPLAACVALLAVGGYFVGVTIMNQAADNAVLVHQLVASLQLQEQTAGERDRVLGERNAQQLRADGLESTLAQTRSAMATVTVQNQTLASQLASQATELSRTQGDVATLRTRLQDAQVAAQDADAAAVAAEQARRRTETILDAVSELRVAGSKLLDTRSEMLKIANDQIDAERKGQIAVANRLVDQYNRLVTTANAQADAYNRALAAVKALF